MGGEGCLNGWVEGWVDRGMDGWTECVLYYVGLKKPLDWTNK